MHPGLGLWLNSNGGRMVYESCASDIGNSCVSFEIFKPSDALESLLFADNDNSALDGDGEGTPHPFSVDEVSCLVLLTDLGAGFIDNLQHALLLHGDRWDWELNLLIKGQALCCIWLPNFVEHELWKTLVDFYVSKFQIFR